MCNCGQSRRTPECSEARTSTRHETRLNSITIQYIPAHIFAVRPFLSRAREAATLRKPRWRPRGGIPQQVTHPPQVDRVGQKVLRCQVRGIIHFENPTFKFYSERRSRTRSMRSSRDGLAREGKRGRTATRSCTASTRLGPQLLARYCRPKPLICPGTLLHDADDFLHPFSIFC